MNIEYIKLSDGTTIITDEKGNIKKRNSEISRNELIIENRKETIDKIINDIQISLDNAKQNTELFKYILRFYPLAFIITILINIPNSVTLYPNLVIVALFGTIYGVTYSKVKNKEKRIAKKLEKAQELKFSFQKELEKEKSLVREEKLMINNPISLTEQNEIDITNILGKIENTPFNLNHQQSKKLVLKKRN